MGKAARSIGFVATVVAPVVAMIWAAGSPGLEPWAKAWIVGLAIGFAVTSIGVVVVVRVQVRPLRKLRKEGVALVRRGHEMIKLDHKDPEVEAYWKAINEWEGRVIALLVKRDDAEDESTFRSAQSLPAWTRWPDGSLYREARINRVERDCSALAHIIERHR